MVKDKIVKLPKNQPRTKAYAKGMVIFLNDFVYKSKKFKKTFTTPAGYLSDGASIPRTFWRVIGSPFLPEYRAASAIHDYLYSSGKTSRKLADEVFLEILKDNHVSKPTRAMMYTAVRVGGWVPWRFIYKHKHK